MSELNDDQQKIKDYVQNCFENNKICHLLIQGVAGTGKSFLINKIVEMGKNYQKKCIIGSHQAIAAALINGLTLCKIFGVMGTRDISKVLIDGWIYTIVRNKNKYESKSCQQAIFYVPEKNFDPNPENNLLIIDEISMVGLEFLDDMDNILQVAFNNKKPFGGIHLIFCGHFAQLRPVKETPIFNLKVDHFVKHMKLFELTINQRQQDQTFFDLCNGVMKSCLKSEQKKLLKSRLASKFDPKIFKDLVHIFPTKKLCYEHNVKRLLDLDEESYYFLKANDSGDYKAISKEEKKCFNGLSQFIIFALNAKIMITNNGEGFLNGEIFKIEHIDLKKEITLQEFILNLDEEDKRSVTNISNTLLKKNKKIYYCSPHSTDIFVDKKNKILYSSKVNKTNNPIEIASEPTEVVNENKQSLDLPSTSNNIDPIDTIASILNKCQLENNEKDIDIFKPKHNFLTEQLKLKKNEKGLTKIVPTDKSVSIVVVGKEKEKEEKIVFIRTIQAFQLAWAVTTHKIQGISLDEGIIDMGESNFDPVQLYVNISRLRSLENMYIRDLKLPLPVSPYRKNIKEFIEEIKTNNKNNTVFKNINSNDDGDDNDESDFDFDD